jgi:hypothetical protein
MSKSMQNSESNDATKTGAILAGENIGRWIGIFIVVSLITSTVYFLAIALVIICYWLHIGAGFIASVAMIIASLSMNYYLKTLLKGLSDMKLPIVGSLMPPKFPLQILLIVFFSFSLTIAIALLGFSSLAYGIQSNSSIASLSSVATGVGLTFPWHFFWHLIDMVPGIKVWETLNIADPTRPEDYAFYSRLCLLIFQFSVVVPFYANIKVWLDLQKKSNEI